MNQQSTIDLDFIKQPFLSVANFSLLGIFCLIFALIMTAFTWQSYLYQQASLANNVSQLERYNKQLKPAKPSLAKPEMVVEAKEIQQIKQTVSALTAPWDALLDGIEQTDMQNIVLLSLTPNLKKQQLLFTGEAKDLASVLQYIKQLEMQPMLSQVYLQKHTVDITNSAKQVNFNVSANWKI